MPSPEPLPPPEEDPPSDEFDAPPADDPPTSPFLGQVVPVLVWTLWAGVTLLLIVGIFFNFVNMFLGPVTNKTFSNMASTIQSTGS